MILRVRLDHILNIHPETLHPAHLAHFFCAANVLSKIAKVLCYSPTGLAGISIGLVPCHQILCCSYILGYRFLRENLFSCCKCFLDESWLGQYRET